MQATRRDLANCAIYCDVVEQPPTNRVESHREMLRRRKRNMIAIRKVKKLDKDLGRIRIFVMGDGQFGQGGGPCPRKGLIREVAKIVPVFLSKEWRSSMTHHVCGLVIKHYD